MSKKITYLASPYTHPDPVVRNNRFRTVCIVAAQLMGKGEFIYSPIAASHPIAEAGGLPKTWDYWAEYDREMISHCGKLIVLKLNGWEESVGIAAEIEIANGFGIPVEYMDL